MAESGISGGGGSAVSQGYLVGEGVPSARTAVAARFGDYAEVFGDLEGSCSIPFLDLPSAFDGLEDDAPPGTLAYSEVFGASSYDEVFAEREEASSSADARKTSEESTSSHQAMLDFKISSPSHFHGNHTTMAHEEGDSTSSSNSIIFDNYLSTQGIGEGISSERITHTTQQKSSENYSKTDQKQQHSISKHSSCSSSSFTLSGDLSSSDTTDMTTSSVSLRRSKVGFDEANDMSAAEAADALLKAMEVAQARLKIAKSSLEKRYQNLQKNNKKVGQ